MENKNKQNTTTAIKTPLSSILLYIAVTALSSVVLVLSILLIAAVNTANLHAGSLEASYQKAFYNLVDDINNAEVRMSKVLSTEDENYISDLLIDVYKNANDAQNNLNALPLSSNGIEESIQFINQLGGYCETLSRNIAKGDELTNDQLETLQQLYDCLLTMKIALQETDIKDNYNILENSLSFTNGCNNFTVQLQSLKTNDVEYPTMIYDGPFADSQINKEVKALKNSTEIVNIEEAKHRVSKMFDVDVNSVKTSGETHSNFETHDVVFTGKSGNDVFAQISKAEGKLITLASYKDAQEETLSVAEAQNIAEKFLQLTGINNARCTWYDIADGNAYFNFAPVENDVILYPDLVKIKCDLSDGEILGYEARSYYTNHVNRNLPEFIISEEEALGKVKDNYVVLNSNKALAPINFAEVLCYEFECGYDGDTYYVYVNALNGSVDEILKVIKTQDGNKIM